MAIPLDSSEWLTFESWSGAPADVPKWIRHWLATRDEGTLTELLFSQRSASQTYSKSAIAALPYFTRELETLSTEQQELICSFAAMTAARCVDDEHRASLEVAERVAQKLVLASETDLATSLSSLAALRNWPAGASFFERFGDDVTELWGVCGACRTDLEFQLEPRGGWCRSAGSKPHSAVYVVTPATDPTHAFSPLVTEEKLRAQFLLFLGTTRCPVCDAVVVVPDSVR